MDEKKSYGLIMEPKGMTLSTDRYEWYAKMRETSPLHFDEERNCWDAFDYNLVQSILQDYKRFSSNRNGIQKPSLLDLDPPTHRRYRLIVNQAFTPRRIEQMRPWITTITRELVNNIKKKTTFDLVQDISYPLPVIVIAEMLGVPTGDREKFKEWSDILVQGVPSDNSAALPALLEKKQRAVTELHQYFHAIVLDRQANPKDDLVSTLVRAQVEGESLHIEELMSFCLLLLVAGNETTTNLITNAMQLLSEHPNLQQVLREDSSHLENTIEEVLRFRSPIHCMNRFVTEDMEWNGQPLKKGDEIVAWMGSANFDEKIFANAHLFDINRKPNPHLSFGSGVHFCIGSSLARLEAHICIQVLLETFTSIEQSGTYLEMIPSSLVFGYTSLPLVVSIANPVSEGAS